MNPATLPRLLRTVRHLRPSQLLWRCRVLAERRWSSPRPEHPQQQLQDGLEQPEFPTLPLFHRAGREGTALLGELRDGRFSYLNRSVDVGRDRPDWQLGPVRSGRLWAITLHYHEWAYSLAEIAEGEGPAAEEAESLLVHYLSDWLHRSDVRRTGARDLAWNSFAIATRIGWWIRTWMRMRDCRRGPWRDFRSQFADSLWQQAAWLHRHLEWDLRGNHLLRDLVGLAWAGRFFDDPTAARWSRT